MDLGLEGRVAIVTGASTGIGRAAALALSAEGAKVLGVSRTPPVDGAGGVEHLALDLTDPAAPGTMVGHAVDRFGRLDVLVNNAAAGEVYGGFLEEDDASWSRQLTLNVMAAVRAIRAAIPHLCVHGGAIVNVTSVNGRVPTSNAAAYSASKAALLNLGKAVASEYATKGVRVVTVSPGLTATPMWLGPSGIAQQIASSTSGDPEAVASATAASTPLGRFLTPEEIATCICFVASPLASGVTGTELVVDGGMTDTM